VRAVIEAGALTVMTATARHGYQARRRHEAMGLLFGRVGADGTVRIEHAEPYRCARQTRMSVCFSGDAVDRRRRELARQLDMTSLGLFHSHVDENGLDSNGQSYEDCQGLYDDEMACIDATVYVWPRDMAPRRKSSTSLYLYDAENRLAFAVRVFGKTRGYVSRLPVEVVRGGSRDVE